jgi:hypothetical protein
MLVNKLTVGAAVLLVLGLVGAGAGVATHRAGAGEPAWACQRAKDEPLPADAEGQPPPPAEPAGETEASFRTTNFAVTAPTPEAAEQVGRAAEQYRQALARLWLGQEMPAWPAPCALRVKVTDRGSASATCFHFDRDKVIDQVMTLEGPLDGVLADLLPHEVTHTVLAHWAGHPLPRWADEGAALLGESAASRARHGRVLAGLQDAGRLLPLRRLLPLHEYPKEVTALYAQGYSLTDFLVRSGSRRTFLAFVAQGERDGWDTAAREQYGYRSVEDLEQAWLARVRKSRQEQDDAPAKGVRRQEGHVAEGPGDSAEGAQRGPVERKPAGRLPAGLPPAQALVALDKEGRLTVWRAVTVYQPKTVLVGGGRSVTGYEMVSALTAARYRLAEVQVYDSKGKAVSPRDLPRMLPGETLALVAQDGRPLDRLHLRLVKEGTLVFVVPAPDAVPPPAVPVSPNTPAAGPPVSTTAPPAASPVPGDPFLPPPAPTDPPREYVPPLGR